MKTKRILSLALAGTFIFANANATDVIEYTQKSSALVSTRNTSTIYISDRRELADGLTGGVLSMETGGSLLTINPENLDSEEQELINNAENIYILGGTSRISEDFENLANFRGRFSGSDRFETAVNVAEELGTDRPLTIVNGINYVDAITSTPMSALENRNILLVESNNIPQSTRNYLETYAYGQDVLFVGGLNSISKEVKDEILQITGNDIDSQSVTLAGDNRYQTSLEIAKRAEYGSDLLLVDGSNYEMAINSANLGDVIPTCLLVNAENAESLIENYKESHAPNQLYSIGSYKDYVVNQAPVEVAPQPAPSEPSGNVEPEPVAPVNKVQRFIDSALAMEGYAYSQSSRMSPGYADCSSLVLKALINSGLTTDKSTNLTSSSIYSDSRFTRISFSQMKPGDILHSPGHLAIFMGNGKVFEAKTWGVPAGYGSYAYRGWDSVFRISGI